jgi:hypothetical protein
VVYTVDIRKRQIRKVGENLRRVKAIKGMLRKAKGEERGRDANDWSVSHK